MVDSADFQMAPPDMDLLDVVPDLPALDELSEVVDASHDSVVGLLVSVFGHCNPFNLNDSGAFSSAGDDDVTCSPSVAGKGVAVSKDPLFGVTELAVPLKQPAGLDASVALARRRSAATVMDAAVHQMLMTATANLRADQPRKSVIALEDTFKNSGVLMPTVDGAEQPFLARSLWGTGTPRRGSMPADVAESPIGGGASSASTPVSPETDSWRSVSPPSSPSTSPLDADGRRVRLKGASTDPKHAAGRNHVCRLCSSRFLCKSKLDRHMLTHTGVKPFGCFCGKRFNQKSALKNHTRRHIKKRNTPRDVNIELHGLNGFTFLALTQQ